MRFAIKLMSSLEMVLVSYAYILSLGYSHIAELTGATVATSLVNRPVIFFEAFVIPPFPEELELPAQKPVKEEQDLWKQWTKRLV